jgi:hypothetical protein
MLVSIEGVARYGQISPLDSYGHIKEPLTFWSFIGLGLLFSVFFIVPTWLILRRINSQTMSQLLRYAFILTSASVIAILLVEIAIKPTLQRERFRFLMSNNVVDPTSM